jgi:hypothetical protein
VRSSILKQTKKHKLDKRLRHKLKRRFAREGEGHHHRRGASLTIGPNGTIIGRPKKPPIIGSEKTDGIFPYTCAKVFRKRDQDLYMPRAWLRKDIPRLLFSQKAPDDPRGKAIHLPCRRLRETLP